MVNICVLSVLSVFDDFVGLALKGLKQLWRSIYNASKNCYEDF